MDASVIDGPINLFDTTEWYDSPAEYSSLKLPESNLDYAYAAMRVLSFWPVVNSNGATFFREDMTPEVLSTLSGKQVNLEHDLRAIVATVQSVSMSDAGIDVVVEIDRQIAANQGLDLTDMGLGNRFSKCSIECRRSGAGSSFVAYDSYGVVSEIIPPEQARAMGLRRTTLDDPFMYFGKRLAERISVVRFTGLGLTANPADTTAVVYKMAASATNHKNQASSGAITVEEYIMSEEDIKSLKAQLTELSSSVAESNRVTSEAREENASLKAEIVRLSEASAACARELASAQAEVAKYVARETAAARESALDSFIKELVAIMPTKDDAETSALRETASASLGDEGKRALLISTRTIASLRSNLEALQAQVAASPEHGRETASAKESTTPVSIAPQAELGSSTSISVASGFFG